MIPSQTDPSSQPPRLRIRTVIVLALFWLTVPSLGLPLLIASRPATPSTASKSAAVPTVEMFRLIEPYRHEWQAEQDALAAIRAAGGYFTTSAIVVGPPWLRRMAGPRHARYFERVSYLGFTASDCNLALQRRDTFRYLRIVIQD